MSRPYEPGMYETRRRRNEESRNHAEHHGEEWLASEDELVLLCVSEQDKIEAAEILGRTVEAVRNRLHALRYGRSSRTYTRTRTVTITHTETVTVSSPLCPVCGLNHPGEC